MGLCLRLWLLLYFFRHTPFEFFVACDTANTSAKHLFPECAQFWDAQVPGGADSIAWIHISS